jgi:hypothetical protein
MFTVYFVQYFCEHTDMQYILHTLQTYKYKHTVSCRIFTAYFVILFINSVLQTVYKILKYSMKENEPYQIYIYTV